MLIFLHFRSPTSGSFVRRNKVSVGVTFFEALQDRYGRIEDDDAGVIQEDMFVVGKNQQTTHVEVVGAKKINSKQRYMNLLHIHNIAKTET